MAHKLSLNVIEIRQPCSADWGAMAGDRRRRHCAACDLAVHNLSAMPRKQAQRLIAEADGRLCVRFEQDGRGRVRYRRSRWGRAGITLLEVLAMLTVFAVLVAGILVAVRSPQVKQLWWKARTTVTPAPAPALMGDVVMGAVAMPAVAPSDKEACD